MRQSKHLGSSCLVAGMALFAAPAWAVPETFTLVGEAVSYQLDGSKTQVPNKLYYQRGLIRLEMSPPQNADGASAFTVVIAKDGGKMLTLLNVEDKQAMKVEATSMNDIVDNKSLQKLSTFSLKGFADSARATGTRVGRETVAGLVCNIWEHRAKDGHFKVWLSTVHDIPLRMTYFDKNKPTFSYTANQFSTQSALPVSAFSVPSGYETTDLSELMKEAGGLQAP